MKTPDDQCRRPHFLLPTSDIETDSRPIKPIIGGKRTRTRPDGGSVSRAIQARCSMERARLVRADVVEMPREGMWEERKREHHAAGRVHPSGGVAKPPAVANSFETSTLAEGQHGCARRLLIGR